MKYVNNIIHRWFYVDSRTLALFRMFFGVLGICDVLRRYPLIDVFYSDIGMNFRQGVVGKYSIKYFSLLDYFYTTFEVQLFFIITAICFFFVIIGLYTRLFQLFAAIGLISIHNAAVILENGADMVFNNFLIWTLFLPLGTSISIDSIRKSLKKYPENNSNDLNQTYSDDSTYNIAHFAYFACLIQLAMIYFYNHINKTGDMWISDYSAIFYMYQLDSFVTPIGELIRSNIPAWFFSFLTRITLYIELFAPIAILSPFFQPWLRRFVLFIFIPFHIIIMLSVNIGLFSWIMLAVLLLLVSTEDIEILKKLFSRVYTRKYTVFYDRDCGFCHLISRIIKRIDVFSNLTWADRLTKNDRPKSFDRLFDTTIVVWDTESGKYWTRHEGFAKILSVLPLGNLFSWVLQIPLLEKIFGYIYDCISNNRAIISTSMGLPACGIENNIYVGKLEENNESKINKLNLYWGKYSYIILNIFACSLLVGAVDFSTRVNDGFDNLYNAKGDKIVKQFKSSYIKDMRLFMKRVLLYPRMHQNWNMFSPNVITYEKWVIAEIILKDKEVISLFNNNKDIENNFSRKYFKSYNNQFWRKLFGRLGSSSYQRYIPKFEEWLLNTDYFSNYSSKDVKSVVLWQLSEKSPSPNFQESHKVVKWKLKKRNKNRRDLKSKNKGYKNKKIQRELIKIQ